MERIIKYAIKDLNMALLREEIEQAGATPDGILLAGFYRSSKEIHSPIPESKVIATSTGQPDTLADPGEIHFKYELTPPVGDSALLDTVLANHDATGRSTGQLSKDADAVAVPILVNSYQNWDTLTNNQKDNVLKHLTRLTARLLDKSQLE